MQKLVVPIISLLIFAGIACGGASSNNLPGRADSADINAIGPGGSSDTLGTTNADVETKAGTSSAADTGKLGGTWFLVAVLPSDTAAGKVPTITFDEATKKFTGHTGCNNMRGTFISTDSTLKINAQIITTKMACPGYNEDAFLKNLPKTNNYRFENGMLVLLNDQNELTRWTREPVKPSTKTT